MENIKNKPNSELVKIKKEIADEYEKTRIELLRKYNYWLLLEKEHNKIVQELNDRFGVNNK